MLDAAEEIVCGTGLGSLTLTAVQRRSGQGNKSAAAYHFGSREGLLSALAARRMTTIDEHRHALLARLAPDCSDLAALTEALVLPLARATMLSPGSRYARFLAQALVHPELGDLVLAQPEGGSFRDVSDRIRKVLSPHLGERLAQARLASAVAMVVTTCALHETHPDWSADASTNVDGTPRTEESAALSDLLTTTLALLAAPAAPVPTTRPATHQEQPR